MIAAVISGLFSSSLKSVVAKSACVFYWTSSSRSSLQVADPDEVDHRVARGDLAAEQAYAARADDREADALRGFSHGRSTAALRSAERSAAM